MNYASIPAGKRGRPAIVRLAAATILFSAASLFAFPPDPPVIPAGITNITSFGAIGDGVATNTSAIQSAINAASAAGIGTVEIPAGTFLSGPFTLKSSINLQLDAGAVLRLLPITKYPGGIVNPANFMTGTSLHDLEISGSGAIDGQGAGWWPGYKTNNRPTSIVLSKCTRVLLKDFTLSNSPAQNISIKGNNAGNVTVQNLTILAPDSAIGVPLSHNTDGIDLAETNALIQNCNISVGDDNVAIGSSAGLSRDITITNCAFGFGHGVSLGSFTFSGISNLTVINCTFNQTQNGIRMKSDNDTKRGGFTRNLTYSNLGMTNVNIPIHIYSYYNEVGTPNSITPLIAATQPVAAVTTNTPIWRDITFSNITATSVGGNPAILVWARTELPATNIFFDHVNISASRPVELYNAHNIQFKDCQFTVGSSNTFALFNAQMAVTNTLLPAAAVSFDGLTTNGYGNSMALYKANAWLANTNVLDDGPLTLAGSTLTISNNLTMLDSTVFNYVLGSNSAFISVSGNVILGGTINISNGPGLITGAYTVVTSSQPISGSLPQLGPTPAGYICSLDTNTPQQLKVQVVAPSSPMITNSPADETVSAGSTASFQVLAGGAAPLSYQWRFNHSNLDGATGSALNLPSVQTNQAGGYDVIVSNYVGSITSAMATLTVTPRPPLLGWGDNSLGQCNPPAGLSNALALSAGAWHALAVRPDGTVAAWGGDSSGECDVPAGLSNVIAVAAGGYHSLALRSDGTLVAWGNNAYGQTAVPANASNVAAIAAGDWYSMTLRVDGTVVAWGSDQDGQLDIPPQATNVIAIAAGAGHCLALRSDGTVVAWGSDYGPTGGFTGQAVVPSGLTQVVAVAAGGYHSLALRASGTVAVWGDNSSGQTIVPSNLTNAIALAAGTFHSVALLANGTVTGWGSDLDGQIDFDSGVQNVTEIAAGGSFSLTLAGQPPAGLRLPTPVRSGKTLLLQVPTERGRDYFLQYNNSVSNQNWLWSSGMLGNGGQKSFVDSITNTAQRFYRVRRQ